MEKREYPILTVSCPDCGSTFFGSVFKKEIPLEEETLNELYQYAADGYNISITDKNTFKFEKCHCKKP